MPRSRYSKTATRSISCFRDIQMPGTCDGIGLVEWIKKQRPTQAVTLMTGYAEHLEQAKKLGVAVLSKPFNADDLSALLSGVR